jgi:DNA-binding MarR family transcriptional regulator
MTGTDPYADLKRCRLPDGAVVLERRVPPAKRRWRQRHFIPVPMPWFERLTGASGHTYRLALVLLYLDWRSAGQPIKLTNRLVQVDGLTRYTKSRSLDDLRRRGLVTVERRPRRAPVVRLLQVSGIP